MGSSLLTSRESRACQEIARFLWNLKLKCQKFDPFQNQCSPVATSEPISLKFACILPPIYASLS